MEYSPSVKTAITYLSLGKPIIIRDRADRESEGDFAFSAKHSTPALVNTALTIARGLICVSLPPEYARKFKITRLQSNNKDIHDTPFGQPVSLANGSSGISAEDRSETIKSLSNFDSDAEIFCTPGHISTLISRTGGLRDRDGHTEAIIDLLMLGGIGGPGVICEVLNSAGAIATQYELESISRNLDIPIVTIEEIYLALDVRDANAKEQLHAATS